MSILSRFFGLEPNPQKTFYEQGQSERIVVWLKPQIHEVVIRPTYDPKSEMSPQQQHQQATIEGLKSVAQEAASLVFHGGLEAATGQKLRREQTDDMVIIVLVEQDKALADAQKRISALEARVAEVTTERDVLARVLRP